MSIAYLQCYNSTLTQQPLILWACRLNQWNMFKLAYFFCERTFYAMQMQYLKVQLDFLLAIEDNVQLYWFFGI